MKNKIYNIDKTQELTIDDCDLNKGYLQDKSETITYPAIEYQEEIGHYETIAEYPNGGKDVQWIVDQPEQMPVEERAELIEYQIYIPYTEDELKLRELENEKKYYEDKLAQTDFKVLKYVEGWYTEEEYEPIKQEREYFREEIRIRMDKIDEIKKESITKQKDEMDQNNQESLNKIDI